MFRKLKQWLAKKVIARRVDAMFEKLRGKKTNLVGIAMILYAASGWFTGALNADFAIKTIMEGIGLITLRAGISKVAK